MKTAGGHTTNYCNTFIEVAEDCPVSQAQVPASKKDGKTVAELHFEMIQKHPYQYTSDDVIFGVFALKNDISESAYARERELFFSKGQACLRCSPLGKRYGWGVHCNEEGKVAICPLGSEAYEQFANDKNLIHVKAMRSKR